MLLILVLLLNFVLFAFRFGKGKRVMETFQDIVQATIDQDAAREFLKIKLCLRRLPFQWVLARGT